MGIDLLNHFLNLSKPKFVLHLATEVIAPFDIAQILKSMSKNDEDFKKLPEVKTLEACVSKNGSPGNFNSTDQRNLSLAYYFAQTIKDPMAPLCLASSSQIPTFWDFTDTLSTKAPYRVPWRDLSIRFLNCDVPFSETLHALNGTLVGLVTDRTTYRDVDSQSQKNIQSSQSGREPWRDIRIVPTSVTLMPKNTPCVGVAVVRGIDVRRRCFLVVTSDVVDVGGVNMLMRGGGVEMPLFLRGDGGYVSMESIEGGVGGVRKTGYRLLRRSLDRP
ncbi:Polynucleotide 5'-hydroxyl-kinase nol9, partial [Nowakowskiella sp. JEL0078]